MKTICGFIGWIIGMLLGFMLVNSVPILGFALIGGGIPLGRYIGGRIEQERSKNEKEDERHMSVKEMYKKGKKLNPLLVNTQKPLSIISESIGA